MSNRLCYPCTILALRALDIQWPTGQSMALLPRYLTALCRCNFGGFTRWTADQDSLQQVHPVTAWTGYLDRFATWLLPAFNISTTRHPHQYQYQALYLYLCYRHLVCQLASSCTGTLVRIETPSSPLALPSANPFLDVASSSCMNPRPGAPPGPAVAQWKRSIMWGRREGQPRLCCRQLLLHTL